MEISRHIESLHREGALLVKAIERGNPGASVPTCPTWQLRDLVHHVSGVHRWAGSYVHRRLPEMMSRDEELGCFGPMPEDTELLSWYQQCLDRLVDALQSATPDLTCWSFLPAPSALAFWARRQAHEAAIHRVDAEFAAGGDRRLSLIPVDFALDGVDELLRGFHHGRSRVRSDKPRVLHIHATDGDGAPADWSVRISGGALWAKRGVPAEPDCTLRGRAETLYLTLWNRLPTSELTTEGDSELLDLWRSDSAIRWS